MSPQLYYSILAIVYLCTSDAHKTQFLLEQELNLLHYNCYSKISIPIHRMLDIECLKSHN